ncbi:Scr1 family TA system antitoxin-like transcriptional regulator [Glycomyces buryatensis]|nr:Scr1 family TA system antitoxin-like transcriptional regulator [Glycomyces buryatensis]
MAQSHLAKWFPGRVEHYYREQKRGYSQRQVGAFMAVNYQTVGRWEQGKKCPTVGEVLALAKFLKIPQELSDYMEEIARNESRKNFQSDRRFNALCLQFAEMYNGLIHKWEPLFIPGIAQTKAYHFNIVGEAEGTTDEQLNRGWLFKVERYNALLARTDNQKVVLLISETALRNLRFLSEADRTEQLERLRYLDSLPNWEIRIVSALHPEGGGAFSIYRADGADFGGPAFVYTEVWDDSWCIEETDRIARYDDLWRILLGKSITLKEYLDDRRDGLAQEHP